jgi:hypothetical protein
MLAGVTKRASWLPVSFGMHHQRLVIKLPGRTALILGIHCDVQAAQ